MGGEDWMLWMQALQQADVLAEGAKTVAYSYIGPEMTHPIYKEGSIGQAKKDLYQTADKIQDALAGVEAYVAVNKAVVTQSSAAIPIVPLYLAILFRVMKEQHLHENCVQQMYRLMHDRLFGGSRVITDEDRLIRMDDWEMKPEVQQAVLDIWNTISQDNLEQVTDIAGYWKEFYEIFGFEIEGVDYDADVETEVEIPSLAE
jgi:enoyl-[acyl-carrier protein] reductase/trans-2-enoyl-CoA reductase (NAD+)